MAEATQVSEVERLESLERRHRINQLEMELMVQEAQQTEVKRALSLDVNGRSLGSAGGQDVQEGLYDPDNYVNLQDYLTDSYGYTSMVSTYTTKTDREHGRNWPHWTSEPELSAFRGTARILATYNKTVQGILENLCNYTVATGFNVKATTKVKDAKQLAVNVNSVLEQFNGQNKILGDLDQEVFIRRVRDGEVFGGLWDEGKGNVAMRIVEPDCVSEPTNKREIEDWLVHKGNQGCGFPGDWTFGVHTHQGDVGKVHGYYIQWSNNTSDWDYLPGGFDPCYPPETGGYLWLEHLKAGAVDRNIKRGVSDFWPIGGDLELARKLLRNLTHGGAMQAAIAWVQESIDGVTRSQANSATMTNADRRVYRSTYSGSQREVYVQQYQPGTVLRPSSGTKYTEGPTANGSGNYVAIYEAMLRSLAIRWAMPEHMITGYAGNNNLASILEAGAPFVRATEKRQTWLKAFWLAIYWKVVWFAWRAGVFGQAQWEEIHRLIDIEVTPPPVDYRRRMEETQRYQILVGAGAMSLSTWQMKEGLDPEEEKAQGAKPMDQQQGGGQPGLPGMPQPPGQDAGGQQDSTPPGSAGGETEPAKESEVTEAERLQAAAARLWGDYPGFDAMEATWDETLHPRDDHGRFIKVIKAANGTYSLQVKDRSGAVKTLASGIKSKFDAKQKAVDIHQQSKAVRKKAGIAEAPPGEKKYEKPAAVRGQMVSVKLVGGKVVKKKGKGGKIKKVTVGGKWMMPNGKPVPPEVAKHIYSGWSDVQISLDPKSEVLVSAKDAAGREQTTYSDSYSVKTAVIKFARATHLAEHFDEVVAENAENRKHSQDPTVRESAAVVDLIRTTGFRIGSEKDTKAEQQAYGATTLEGRHIVVKDGAVSIQCTGKKGVNLNIAVTDKAVAADLIQRKKRAGDKGKLFATSDTKVRDYVGTLGDGYYLPKDFRTKIATELAWAEVQKAKVKPRNTDEYKEMVGAIAGVSSKQLGNTPGICLEAYINPFVFHSWASALKVIGPKDAKARARNAAKSQQTQGA